MKHKHFLLFVLLAVPFLIFEKPAHKHSSDHIEGEIMVMLQHSMDKQQQAIDQVMVRYAYAGVEVIKAVSPHMNIWLLKIDQTRVSEDDVLQSLRSDEHVVLAQYNHYIELRQNIPSDQYFELQWGKHNTGQTGGLEDADMDAPEAWEYATGGLTATGDTIIVAIVDDGFDLNHEDLTFWKNYGEIPGNGIDDDLNGYIDDYDGWNSYNNNGYITSTYHGTHVTGVAVANGNNDKGVCGVNWNTKVLPVQGSSTSEAITVNSYAYVYRMRKLYNKTNGTQGAFIVASNSSFGVNNGQPEDYPIWEAMYDSLGSVGILNAGATSNSNVNVDLTGDIPTAFDNASLISVTNTTDEDLKANAGYGATSIELGSPGTDIYSTRPNNTYNKGSGTSYATPQVTGAIALIYSAVDTEFMLAYHEDPEGMALVVRDYLLMGVDPIESLQGKTITGGRLNVYNAIYNLLNDEVKVTPPRLTLLLPENAIGDADFSIENQTEETKVFVVDVTGLPSWLMISPASGTIAPDSSTDIQVYFNSTGLEQGSYSYGIHTQVGDQSFVISARLTTPTVTVEPREVIMRMKSGMQDTAEIKLINNLKTEVDFTIAFEASPEWVTAEPDTGTIKGDSTEAINLYFNTDGLDNGVFEVPMTINYLGHTDTIPITLYNPPLLIIPNSITRSLGPDINDWADVLIRNLAPLGSKYNVEFEDQPSWIYVQPLDGFLDPEEMDTLRVFINTPGLEEGVYQTEFTVYYGDLDFVVPVELQVTYFGIDEGHKAVASYTAFPNPFSGEITFSLSLDEPASVELMIYDQLGRKVYETEPAKLLRGDHKFGWNGRDARGYNSNEGIYHAVILINGEMAFSDKIIRTF